MSLQLPGIYSLDFSSGFCLLMSLICSWGLGTNQGEGGLMYGTRVPMPTWTMNFNLPVWPMVPTLCLKLGPRPAKAMGLGSMPLCVAQGPLGIQS